MSSSLIYRRLFSHASIRRPEDWHAAAPYVAMRYLYNHSNRFWRHAA